MQLNLQKSLVAFISLAMSACGSVPKQNFYDPAATVPAFHLGVADISTTDESDVRERMEFSLGLGFDEMATARLEPTPGAMLRKYVEKALQAAGDRGVLQIRIMRAGLYVKRQIEDRVPVLNLFVFGSTPRPYMCDAEFRITSLGEERIEKVKATTPTIEWKDIQRGIADCQIDLVRQLGVSLAGLALAKP